MEVCDVASGEKAYVTCEKVKLTSTAEVDYLAAEPRILVIGGLLELNSVTNKTYTFEKAGLS